MVFAADGAEEVRALERRLRFAGHEGRVLAHHAVRKAAFDIERGAKRRAAVDTGALRNSINTMFEGSALSDSFTAEVGPEVHYGVHLEFGTERMAPRPFLGPAYDAVEPSFLEALRQIDPLTPGGITGAVP